MIIKRIAINLISENIEMILMASVWFILAGLSFWGITISASDNEGVVDNNVAVVSSEKVNVAVVSNLLGCPSNRKVSVNASFGYSSLYFGGGRFHNGIDLNLVYDNVYSITNGVVTFAGWDSYGGGNMMIVRDGDVDVWYAHLSMFTAYVGQKVKIGDRIAISGNSGSRSTGAHLHLSVKVRGRFVDPASYLADCIK